MPSSKRRSRALAVAALEILARALDRGDNAAVRGLRDRFDERIAPARDRVAGRLRADPVNEENAELVLCGRHAVSLLALRQHITKRGRAPPRSGA